MVYDEPKTHCFICGRVISKYESRRLVIQRYDLGKYKQYSNTNERYDLCEKDYDLVIALLKKLEREMKEDE